MAANQAESPTNSPANEQFDYAQALQNSFLLNEVTVQQESKSAQISSPAANHLEQSPGSAHIFYSATIGDFSSKYGFDYYQ